MYGRGRDLYASEKLAHPEIVMATTQRLTDAPTRVGLYRRGDWHQQHAHAKASFSTRFHFLL